MIFDKALETLAWDEQVGVDDATYRSQIKYLFERSDFYREKLSAAGFTTAQSVGGLEDIATLPFTTKDELRQSRDDSNAIGGHLAASLDDVMRIYSTSGTTGTPSYIPLTKEDIANWVTISSRSYSASGARKGHRIVSTYNAGPFVAGVALDAFGSLGLCHIPVGTGNTERLMAAVQLLKPDVLACTPSYALYLSEWAEARRIDINNSTVQRILVAGEPGGGEAALRARIEGAWGATVTEAMGIGDISISLWGECEQQAGMHFSGRGIVHFEIVDPDTGAPVPVEDGAEGELVYTHLAHLAAPLLRFRSRDHVVIHTGPCSCGRTAPRVRCIGRTDDMLIIRGVNVFPSAVREVINEFAPAVTGVISIRPSSKGVKQDPPLTIAVELAYGTQDQEGLAERIRQRIRDKLIFTSMIEFVPKGSLPRTDYKSKLVDTTSHA
jgi:phenylacetate-CoA ligase